MDDGRIIAQIRNHNKPEAGETFQSESADGGRTWTVPKPIGVWGLPSHLLKLKDGRLIMTYGYRRKPFGNQARLSVDQGRTCERTAGDLRRRRRRRPGLPFDRRGSRTGTLLTVWYEFQKAAGKAVLRQAKWKIGK
jgi:hypothetical protein